MVTTPRLKSSELQEVIKRLDVLIGVTLDAIGKEKILTTRDKILTLKATGLGPSEVGRILGVQTSYVTATIAQTKKKPLEDQPPEKNPSGA
jgi:hypothetical protein